MTMTSSDGALFKLKKQIQDQYTHRLHLASNMHIEKCIQNFPKMGDILINTLEPNYLGPNFTLQCNYQSIFQHMYALDILLTSEPLKLNANLFGFVENIFGNEAMALIYPRTCAPISTEHHLKIA